MKKICVLIAGGLIAAAPGVASADIGWETTEGTMYWEDVVGDTAVMLFDDGTKLYLQGMAADEPQMYQNGWVEDWSGSYSGYWVNYDSGEALCPTAIVDHYDQNSLVYGRAEITFTNLRNFTLKVGECDGPLEIEIIGYE